MVGLSGSGSDFRVKFLPIEFLVRVTIEVFFLVGSGSGFGFRVSSFFVFLCVCLVLCVFYFFCFSFLSPALVLQFVEIMSLWRTQLSSFLSGFAVASMASMLLLRNDVWTSHRVLSDQTASFESRIKSLEERISGGAA